MVDSRLVILGVDGLDMEMVDRWKKELPNLMQLKGLRNNHAFHSIFPPDTTPAWATIYTGLNPAQHGVINFVNPADKQDGYAPLKVSDRIIAGKTFWDGISEAGYKSCVVLPMLISPGWEIKGSMLCRSTNPSSPKNPLTSFPPGLVDKYKPDPPKLNLFGGFYGESQLKDLYQYLRSRTEEEGRLTMEMLNGEQWQLFFTYFSAIDEVQHVFWPYCDPSHPLYPGPNEFQDTILNLYKMFDKILGRVLSECADADKVLVISDHGQGPRPGLVVNINEWLRREGHLTPISKSGVQVKNEIKSKVKNLLINFVKKYGAGKWIMKVSAVFPVWKKMLAPSSGIDWDRTRAYVSDLSTVKNYSYGGIRIIGVDDPKEKDLLIENIISKLLTIQRPETGERLVTLAKRREDVYQGEYIDKYPEIIIEIDERYGIGWDFSGNLFSEKTDIVHLKPGTHRRYSAVFLHNGIECDSLQDVKDVCDINSLVMDFFGLLNEKAS